jgi:peptidoglycan/xylan/chitin deacetylase (PgdA/CDA1 family)
MQARRSRSLGLPVLTRDAPALRGGALFAAALTALALVPRTPARALPPLAAAGANASVPASQFGAELQGGGIVMGPIQHRLLHFTFDDGPDARTTPHLLDLLDRYGVKATFFFSTSRFDNREKRNAAAPDLAHEVARRGHQLGSHGYQHQRMARMKPPELQFQMSNSEAMFQKVFGTRTFLIRPPFGSRNEALDQMLADGRYVTVIWNIGMADWNQRPPDQIEQTFWRVVARNESERGERGGVILLHDTHAWSIEAFALIMDSIAKKNCELLGAGEELYDVVESLAPWVKPLSEAALEARQAALRERTKTACTGIGSGGHK